MITITSKKNGFRRCGIVHAEMQTEYANDAFTPEQMEILQAEPLLTVVVTDDKKGKGKKDEA